MLQILGCHIINSLQIKNTTACVTTIALNYTLFTRDPNRGLVCQDLKTYSVIYSRLDARGKQAVVTYLSTFAN